MLPDSGSAAGLSFRCATGRVHGRKMPAGSGSAAALSLRRVTVWSHGCRVSAGFGSVTGLSSCRATARSHPGRVSMVICRWDWDISLLCDCPIAGRPDITGSRLCHQAICPSCDCHVAQRPGIVRHPLAAVRRPPFVSRRACLPPVECRNRARRSEYGDSSSHRGAVCAAAGS